MTGPALCIDRRPARGNSPGGAFARLLPYCPTALFPYCPPPMTQYDAGSPNLNGPALRHAMRAIRQLCMTVIFA